MAKKQKETPKLELNLTSMMDVSFQLIIFFILITNFAAADLPKLSPPDPTVSTARKMPDLQRVQINIVPLGESGEASHLVIFGKKIRRDAYAEVTNMLKVKRAENKDIEVYIRADGSLYFEQIQPIMRAITDAGISRIDLVAIRNSD